MIIVGEGVFDTGLFVGDDGEGRDLGAGAGGGGDGDEIRLFTHVGEGVDTLADVAEAHGHVVEVGVRVFVEHPHDLGRVHGRAAANGDDDVRAEGLHLCGALSCAGKGRIGRDAEEHGVVYAQLVELVGDGLESAAGVGVVAGNDEGALLIINVLELV